MNASRLPKTPGDDLPPIEAVPGPVARQRVEPHWLGMPARFALLCLGCAAFGASIGLLATGSWAWGLVAFLFAAVVLAALGEAMRRHGGLWTEQSARLAADGRAHATTVAEVWRTRFDATLTRWRTRTRLDEIDLEHAPAFRKLGEAVWRNDSVAEQRARQRLVKLEHERQRVEAELAEQLAGAEERIRRARLPVQETMSKAPYPPPDEGTPHAPASDPGQADE